MRKQGRLHRTIEIDVAFHDVDLMSVVWHGHYLKYMENARWALMDDIGYGFADMVGSGYLWPIVDTHLRFIRPARFGERIAVTASLVEWDSRLVVNYLVADARSGARVARGQTVQVAVDGASGEMQFRCPADFRDRIATALAAD